MQNRKKLIVIISICSILSIWLFIQIIVMLNTKYLDKGVKIANMNVYKMNEAIYNNNISEVKKLIKWTDVNQLPLSFDDDYEYDDVSDEYDDNNVPPLVVACSCDNYEIAKILVEHGANVNYYNPLGGIIYDYNGTIDEYRIVKLLVEHGANVDIEYIDGSLFDDFFKYASISDEDISSNKAKISLKIFKLFINNHTYDKSQLYQMLNSAVKSGNLLIVKYLINNYKLDVNYLYEGNKTLLMEAVNNSHKEIVKYLLEQNANILIKDNNGNTALSYAKLQSEQNMIDLLK